jgi:hypothetical protein
VKNFEQDLIATVTFGNIIRSYPLQWKITFYEENIHIYDTRIILEILMSLVKNPTLKPKKEVLRKLSFQLHLRS